MELDGGLHAVTLVRDDAEAVTEMVRACELEDGGIAERTLENTLTVIGRPSFPLADSAIGVRDGDALVAYAALPWTRAADAFVLPSHRGRRIGTALVRWTWDAARALGYPAVGQSVHERRERGRPSCVLSTDSRTGALGLYEHVGMTPRGTYLHLERPLR